jgi:type II secretory pathway pseudopilin PulG
MSEGTPFFTRAEWLVVIAIVAITSVLAALAVNNARAAQRDAVRISHVRQLGAALENYYNESGAYPAGEVLALGDASSSACLDVEGFRASCPNNADTLLRVVSPTIEKGLDGLVSCGNPARAAYCYAALQDGQSYGIQFELERDWAPAGLRKGVNCALPSGLKAGGCLE